MRDILILGAGFGGLETATGLADALGGWSDADHRITLVDRSDSFYVGFSKIDVLFGRATPREVSFRYEDLRAEGVHFVRDTVTEIDTAGRTVRTTSREFSYDVLVVALGADLDTAAVPGFAECGGHEFYSMPGAEALAPVLAEFSAGRLVLAIFRTPYKCPPAPYEVACQLDDAFRARGVRAAIELAMVIPGARPVPNPGASDLLESRLARHGVELLAGRPVESVDAAGGRLITGAGAVAFDLLVGVPVHVPPPVVARSGISDGGFVNVDVRTLETRVPDVYAIGDVTHVPAADKVVPKAGAFAEDAARTVVAEILRREGFGEERVPFRARGACYADLGGGEVARLDGDFLGGDAPRMTVAGPSPALRADKERFASERRDRWFRGPAASA